MARHSSYCSPFNASAISVGRVSISAWITSSISFISLSIQPSSLNTQISPAYSSIAVFSSLSTGGHLFLPFPLPLLGLGFLPFFALASATALLEHVSIAAMVFSPNDVPALQIIIIFSSVKQRPFSFSFPFPFFATTEATARERTKTIIRDLMVLGVVED